MTVRFKIALLASIVFTGSANAATTIDIPTVSCSSATQLCEPAFSTSVTTTAGWKAIQFKFDVSALACSSARLHIFLDGVLVKTTGWLGWTGAPSPFDKLPLTTGNLILQYVRPGAHVISINPEGQLSGCNTSGRIVQWEGKLQLK